MKRTTITAEEEGPPPAKVVKKVGSPAATTVGATTKKAATPSTSPQPKRSTTPPASRQSQQQQQQQTPPRRALTPEVAKPKPQKPQPMEVDEDDEEEELKKEPAPRPNRAVTPEKSTRHDEEEEQGEVPPAQGEEITKYRVSKGNLEQLAKRGITRFFPIQSATFDAIYDGSDLVGRALTGSGKTLSFVLPVVEKMMAEQSSNPGWRSRGRLPRVLCIAPTRELARQDAEEFERCAAGAAMSVVLVYGGVEIGPQCRALRAGADVVVGTPGRIIDLIERSALSLAALRHQILDEADEMLSFGFAEDVEKILTKGPSTARAQTLLFSATMPAWVQSVAKKYLKEDHVSVDLVGGDAQRKKIPEGVRHLALCCGKVAAPEVLRSLLLVPSDGMTPESRTIVFAQTKHEADGLFALLTSTVSCQVIHGNVSQAQREASLREFRGGKFSTLIATDVAARGLDISGVDRVIMSQVPRDIESYIHRAGRTGRAGKGGVSIVLYQRDDARILHNIQKTAGIEFRRIGVPQASALVKVSMIEVSAEIAAVPASMSDGFMDEAKALAEREGGPLQALAKALAKLTKAPPPSQALSLLGGIPGFVTLLMRPTRTFRHRGIAVSLVREYMPDGESAREMTLCSAGAIFDVPHTIAQKLLAAQTFGEVASFEAIEELPQDVTIPSLEDLSNRMQPSGGRFARRSNTGGFRRFGGNSGGGNQRRFGNQGGGGQRRFGPGGNQQRRFGNQGQKK